MEVRELTREEQNSVILGLRERMRQRRERGQAPDTSRQQAEQTISQRYKMFPDGADADSGFSPFDDSSDEQLSQTMETSQSPETIFQATMNRNQNMIDELLKNLTPEERKPATPETVNKNIESTPPMQENEPPERVIERLCGIMSGIYPGETAETKQARREAAQSEKTDIKPEVARMFYSKDSCMSQGKPVNYKVVMKTVDWGKAIKQDCSSVAESIEYLSSFITNAIRDCYGGWGRITEIIVRDQQLIINRTCFRPSIDPKTINPDVFPIDTLDYIKSGAIASFFDWRMLKYMRNLNIIDVDDMNFYTINIGGCLKCGRRIGVSSLFNFCPSLEVLILGGEEVTRDDLSTEKSEPLKRRLATHKRFHLFADGYKIDILKGTSSLSDWTFNNMKNYANNRGNTGIFRYGVGLLARAGVAGVAGFVNLGSHLVGGIFQTLKEAMTPVNPEDVGLN